MDKSVQQDKSKQTNFHLETGLKGDLSYINSANLNKQKLYLFTKRTFDFVGALLGILLLLPLFIIVGLIIWLNDFGPVFYSQLRVGKNNKVFKMYKFRSMVINADEKLKELLAQNEVEGAMFKMKNDPRVTKIGHFIRKYSIDELPQLWNVLIGDMSLVGPRPPLPREVKDYSDYDQQRLYVKPGCTGLWQVSGRNDVGFAEMVELDIKYIQQRGIITDIRIILKTVWVMIHPNGAY